MIRLLAFTVVLAACTDLPGYDEAVCGNGVIDPGDEKTGRFAEDCDNTGGKCDEECRVICDTDAQCHDTLPTGYRCGVDHRCYAPSGVFAKQGTPFQFFVGQGGVADLDGDGIGDVVGFSDITIDVRFGDPAGALSTQALALLPYSGTQLAMREYTPGLSDLLVPTPDGIVAYRGTDKRLISHPFANASGGGGDCATLNGTVDPIGSFDIDKHHMGFVTRDNATGVAGINVLDVTTGLCEPEAMCGITLPDQQTASPMNRWGVFVDHYETPTSPVTSMIAVSIVPPQPDMTNPVPQQVCLARYNGTATQTITPLTGTAMTLPPYPLAWARSTVGAVCPTLFTPRTGGIDAYAPLGTASTCTVATTPAAVPMIAGTGAAPAGHIPLAPPIAGKGPDALVVDYVGVVNSSSDVYALAGITPTPMYHGLRALYPVLAADLDGDGRIEGVAAAAAGGQGQPDIDVLYRTAIDTFVTYRITTQSLPTHVTLGDFDGNQLADIAYTEGAGGRERLMVAYGTPDRPLPAVEVANFTQIVSFNRVDVPDSIEPTGNALDDLLIADLVQPPRPELTILHGNPQRSMLAYYDPRGPIRTVPSSLVAAVPGHFENTGSTDNIDVAVLEAMTLDDTVKLRIGPGIAGTESLGEPLSPFTTNIVGNDCSDAAAPLCTKEARYLRWPLADRRDVIIAVDSARSSIKRGLVTIDPAQRTGDMVLAQPSSALEIDPRAIIFVMWPGDLDGNTRNNLYVTVGGVSVVDRLFFGTPNESVQDCTVDDQGHVTACTNVVDEVPALAGFECEFGQPAIAAPLGRFDEPREVHQSLFVLCKRDLEGYVFRIDQTGEATFTATKVLRNAGLDEFVSLADLNGDHLDDMAVITFDPSSMTPIVEVRLQCASRDVKCRKDNEVPQ